MKRLLIRNSRLPFDIYHQQISWHNISWKLRLTLLLGIGVYRWCHEIQFPLTHQLHQINHLMAPDGFIFSKIFVEFSLKPIFHHSQANFQMYLQIICFWVNKKLFYTFLLIPPGKTLQKNYIKTLCPYHHPLPPGQREITNPAGQLFFLNTPLSRKLW